MGRPWVFSGDPWLAHGNQSHGSPVGIRWDTHEVPLKGTQKENTVSGHRCEFTGVEKTIWRSQFPLLFWIMECVLSIYISIMYWALHKHAPSITHFILGYLESTDTIAKFCVNTEIIILYAALDQCTRRAVVSLPSPSL